MKPKKPRQPVNPSEASIADFDLLAEIAKRVAADFDDLLRRGDPSTWYPSWIDRASAFERFSWSASYCVLGMQRLLTVQHGDRWMNLTLAELDRFTEFGLRSFDDVWRQLDFGSAISFLGRPFPTYHEATFHVSRAVLNGIVDVVNGWTPTPIADGGNTHYYLTQMGSERRFYELIDSSRADVVAYLNSVMTTADSRELAVGVEIESRRLLRDIDPSAQYLRVSQVEQLSGVDASYVSRMVSQGKIEGTGTGTERRVSVESLRRYLRAKGEDQVIRFEREYTRSLTERKK